MSLRVEQIVFGDLTGDGNIDAAVVLTEWRGGTGVQYDVAAVVDVGGRPRVVSRYMLDSSIWMLPPVIRDGRISIAAVIHRRSDHKHEPSLPWIFELRLEGNELVPQQPRPNLP